MNKTLITLMLVAAATQNAWAEQAHRCLVEPDHVAEVGSQVTGVLDSVHAERGDPVRKGQLLARLHAGVERASVTVAATRAQADADLNAAQTKYDFQRQKLDRAEELVNENFISKQALDEVRAETNVAKQQYIQAREQHRIAQRELELAQERLKMREIRAPFAGIVAERYVTVGERVEEKAMFRIARVDPLRVEIIVPAALFGTVANGMLAEVTPDLPEAKTLQAKVVLVDRMIDPASNTFRVRAELPNADSAIPPGLRCHAKLHPVGKQVRAAPTAPPAASNEDPVKVRPASFKLDAGLTMTNELANTSAPTKTINPTKAIEPTKTYKRSSAQISSH
jgi:membrane fusion protein, heavy metal efflux system